MSFSFYSLLDRSLKGYSKNQNKQQAIIESINRSNLSYNSNTSFTPYQSKFEIKDFKESPDRVKQLIDILEDLKSKDVFQEIEIAEVDENLHIKIDEDNLIIFKKTSLQNFYKDYLSVENLPRYTASVNVAEFHTYIVVEDTEREAWKAIGGTVYPIGKEFGTFYVRNDTTYHQKYSRSIVEHKQGYNSFFDKGYHYVKKYITSQQLQDLKLHAKEEFCAARDLQSQKYSVIGVDGRNCADFSNFASKYVFDDHNWFRFIDVDKIDYRDKGVLYNFWSTYGAFELFYYKLPKVFDAVLNELFRKGIDEILYRLPFMEKYYYGATKAHIFAMYRGDYNRSDNIEDLKPYLLEKNFFGNTPLHDALIFGHLENAKFIYISEEQLSIKNNRGETPLMLLAKLPASPLKHEIMEKWAALVDAEDCDLYCEYNALTYAVLAQDDESVKILLDNGANPNLVNDVLDGIGNIAVGAGKFGALDTLIKHSGTDFLYHDNLTRQLPICIIKGSESNNPDLIYLKELLHEELSKDLHCKTHDEYHNIFEDHQQIEFLI